MFFIVRARFLADYRGREWPPSPARLFKAFVAVTRHAVPGTSADELDGALRWLEGKVPLVLAAAAEPARSGLRRFVPNNSQVDPKTGKPEWPTRRVSKEGEEIFAWAIQSPFEVVYAWPAAGRERKLEILEAVARRMPSLGKGEDFVVASAGCAEELPVGLRRYEPTAEGFTLEVPEAGCLSVCKEIFRRRAADPGWNRIHELPTMGTRPETYAEFKEEFGGTRPPIAIFEMWTRGRRRSFDARLLRIPVGQCRHLLSSALDDVVRAMTGNSQEDQALRLIGQGKICGHAPDGGKVDGAHLAVVALPSIFGPYPDGRIRRLALIGFGCVDSVGTQLFEGVAANLHGRELIDNGKGTGVEIRKRSDEGWLSLLSSRAAEWESVTPMVLDKPEFIRKDWERLGHAERRRAALAGDAEAATEIDRTLASRRENLVRGAVERLGVAQVLHIELTRAPWRAGLYPAAQYRTQGYLRASPRFHVRITFRNPIAGPILVGRGRYVGFGLLRPAS